VSIKKKSFFLTYSPASLFPIIIIIVIPELEKEVAIQNSPQYRSLLSEQLEIDRLIETCQFMPKNKQQQLVRVMKSFREKIRTDMKVPFNANFGSPFRTHRTSSLFAYSVQRFADVYTSKVTNFLEYPTYYTFMPERTFLPHEVRVPSRVSGPVSIENPSILFP
jgi:hypothetical protein